MASHAAAALAVAAALVLTACGGGSSGPQTFKLEIPKEADVTASAGATGATSSRTITAHVGDKLIVTNHDTYLRIVAERPVRAGQTVTIPLNRPGTFKTGCSYEPRHKIVVVVRER